MAAYDTQTKRLIQVSDMPLSRPSELRLTPQKPTIDFTAVAWLVKLCLLESKNLTAVIEKVSAAPKQGVSSMFRFGEGYGGLQGVLAALEVKTYLIPPSVWKNGLAGLQSASKADSLTLARGLFKSHASLFARQKDNGRAEAALIAYYWAESTKLR